MVKIKIKSKYYDVKALSDLSIKEYFNILKFIEGNITDDTFRKYLSSVTDIPKEYIDIISLDSFSEKEIESMVSIKSDGKVKINFGKGLIKFNDMLVKTYIDATSIAVADLKQMDKLSGILALMYSGDQTYTNDEFTAIQEDIKNNMPITYAMETYGAFDNWRNKLTEHYQGLFEDKEEEEEEEDVKEDEEKEKDNDNPFGLEGVVMSLCSDNILLRDEIKKKVRIIEMFEWLAYHKLQNDKRREKEKIRNR